MVKILRTRVVHFAAILALVLAAWAAPVSGAAPTGPPILIGSINDVTGFAATFGIPERDGQRLAVKAVNDAGGVKGRALQLVERDTQGDANRSVQYFEELASDAKVAAIAGFTTSNDANAVKKLANGLKVPMFAFAGAPSYLGMLGTPLVGPQNWGDSAVLQASGASAERVLVGSSLAGSDPKPGAQTRIYEVYRAFSGKPLHSGAMWGWDAIHILAIALGRVAPETGNVDRARLKAALDQLEFKGATGTFRFTATTHELVDPADAVMGIVEDGKWIRYASRKKK